LVVPESSERCTAVIGAAGRVASGLSATSAASFQVVISPEKIFARTVESTLSSSTPSTLKITAMGEM
jgi:hypothetical protein